jgi:CDP-diglyceride synthetase
MGPIIMFVGITMFTFISFRGKNQDITLGIIIAGASALMFILEYFMLPRQNTVFYILLVIMSSSIFLTFYYSLKPQNLLSKRVKILSWTGSFLFTISLFILMGIILDNLTLSLIMGVATIIILVAAWLIRRSIPKDDILPDELNEGFTTENPDKYWFKYEKGGFPKPVSWQGWFCDLILFLSPFVVIIFIRNLETGMVIVFAIILAVIVVIMLKSNYREIMMEYRKDLKK